MRSNRILDLENYIIENKTVSLDTLCEVFEVSKNTIRRDLNELVLKGSIKKVYGGVSVNDESSLVPFDERNIKNMNFKIDLGRCAAEFVNDGDIIFMDSGTTTLNMIDYMKDKHNVTILTNNLEIIVKSLNYPNLNIITLPGSLIRETNSFVGIDTISMLRKYNINKSFMASTGISIEGGITNSHPLESEIKRLAIDKSSESFLLVDSTKFDSAALVTYADIRDVNSIITNSLPSKKYVEYTKENSINLIITD
ncbi:DeoR/GlpR transcriptional regulator [Romboutsia weinsteinii]|uniref:DeoR/GlpR transcriptional regulator n=1 Tax=Romboutsia weinsteinii TaxID=2020949 RepID=A0A371J5W3_9FIRM|nr:DeoR/GlpR family DNA-binding transcription regulator [Romboutsia weinsteinii]RDY28073.1 DeoR/GlpR transcriptional regulator [Romboutsia weinsteinii]